jgi:beta-galactosidase
MKTLVQSLDTTRPITVGGTPGSFSYSDVLDVHYGNGSIPDTVFSAHASDPSKAVSQSESFAWSIYDDFKLGEDNPWMVGSWVWTAWDYIGESAVGAPAFGVNSQAATSYGIGAALGQVPYPWFNSFTGDFDLIGQRKPQNYLRQVVYGLSSLEMLVERPAPPGTQQFATVFGYYDELRSWTWNVPQGQAMTVHVYTSGDSVTLLLNGKPVATKTLTDSDKRMATFTAPYTPGELTAIASANGKQLASQTLTTVGAPAAIRLTSDVKSLTTDGDDLAYVLAEVVDRQGRVVPDAVLKVDFQVVGSGKIIGVGNGNPHDVDSFERPRHYTWHGQALAVLRPAKSPGWVELCATAQGLNPSSLSLRVNEVEPSDEK